MRVMVFVFAAELLRVWGGGRVYFRFQVTEMMEGFFWVSNFRFGDFLGYENCGKYFLGNLI